MAELKRGRALLGAGLLLALGGSVFAMPQFRLTAIRQLHYDKLDPLWQYSGKVMGCTFCHVNKGGGAPWNVFGQALQKGFQANPKSNFGQVLFTVLSANGDSDGDGYPDAIEVFANTLPGDPASHPDTPLAELEQAFAAAGGVAMYASKKGGK
ncbi:thrombospondin type 3 repeat-containing protein [Deinococcus altitudinis]|uniref:thrombospondin type 3 repeat-containing protein n=1 Tax=Deinococcus altitudinis TaxID=468914 RepID=UPI003891C26D